jgi:hypothetical protein
VKEEEEEEKENKTIHAASTFSLWYLVTGKIVVQIYTFPLPTILFLLSSSVLSVYF